MSELNNTQIQKPSIQVLVAMINRDWARMQRVGADSEDGKFLAQELTQTIYDLNHAIAASYGHVAYVRH